MSTRRTATDPRRRTGDASLGRWLLLAIPVVALAVAIAANVASESGQRATGDRSVATDFVLSATTGDTVALDDVLADGDALVYFSMGVGCDGCFAQIPEVDDALTDRGIQLVPIMVDPPDLLAQEAARFGIDRPILVDHDRSVSDAYGMLGQFGHGDRPSHSFAHVAIDGTIEHTLHYATMFVPLEQLLADLEL